jgi:hypothetical protein
MSYTFFGKEITHNYPYLLLSVYHKYCDNCGSYYKGEDGEYIVSILTGEKFYSLKEFVSSIKGYDMGDEWLDSFFYNEEIKVWIPLIYI